MFFGLAGFFFRKIKPVSFLFLKIFQPPEMFFPPLTEQTETKLGIFQGRHWEIKVILRLHYPESWPYQDTRRHAGGTFQKAIGVSSQTRKNKI
jgi:hypothetical protein